MRHIKPVYCPALRMKAGELEGVGHLTAGVADCVLPRFIVPPQAERDEASPVLFEIDEKPDISGPLSTKWQRRPVLIDSSYIFDEFGRNKVGSWLPAMFERARNRDVSPIPMAMLSDLGLDEVPAFRAAIDTRECIKFGLCIKFDEIDLPDTHARIAEALTRIKLTPVDCVVIVDFGGSEFENPGLVAPIISFALETLEDFGPWQQVIFQGSHYPEVNPAKDGGVVIWPRNEWLAWCQAVHFGATTAEHMTFGDYAADCAKIAFGASAVSAIRHIRYATKDGWRIHRAAKSGTDAERMRSVYKAIRDCDEFAGEAFSQADTFIALASIDPNIKPGNAKTWRQLNTTHHITQAVEGIAKVRGFEIATTPTMTRGRQLSLLHGG